MSRQIDYENLSDEDKQYLRDRPWLTQPDDEIEDTDEIDTGSEEGYEALSHADLKLACESRSLSKSGSKAELIERLVADDEIDS